MLERLLKLPEHQSLFLFGARGTGKSTLVKHQFDHRQALYINLLNQRYEERFLRDPHELYAEVNALSKEKTIVVIDEVQKIPKLLDIVHLLIEETDKTFILTGSSARKLKRGGANLLAGRAFVYHLYPFSFLELGEAFNLDDSLRWGMLPKLHMLTTDEEKTRFLQAYTYTYLKEEVWSEQLIKKIEPFRRFLEVSAQCNGKIINYANIARDVGVDDKTVMEYFSILEDTLLGFFLEPFQHSFRKRLSQKPKFYYIDGGISRALTRLLSIPLVPSTSGYGDAFEHFIIAECLKLASYTNSEFRFSYLKTKDDNEVDLVVERPGKSLLMIEIKSATQVGEDDLRNFISLTKDFGECEAVCFSRDTYKKRYQHVTIYPWKEGVEYFFNL